MKQEMIKAFDEVMREIENVETYILIAGDGKKQVSFLQGKISKTIANLYVEGDEMREVIDEAIKVAKVQIKINELVAEARKQGITLPGMDDGESEAKVEADTEKE